MDRVNEDCILTFMTYLNIAAILAFGATNVRHHEIVSNYFNRLAARGTINFILRCPQSEIVEILQRFGSHFRHLDIHIGEETINMDIFEDFDGCLTPNIHQLIIRACIEEPNQHLVELPWPIYDAINDQQATLNFQQMIVQFQRNSQFIIDSINNNSIPHLRTIEFHFEVQFSVASYLFLSRTAEIAHVYPIIRTLFSSLRRGNLHFDHVYESNTLVLILIFNLFRWSITMIKMVSITYTFLYTHA